MWNKTIDFPLKKEENQGFVSCNAPVCGINTRLKNFYFEDFSKKENELFFKRLREIFQEFHEKLRDLENQFQMISREEKKLKNIK